MALLTLATHGKTSEHSSHHPPCLTRFLFSLSLPLLGDLGFALVAHQSMAGAKCLTTLLALSGCALPAVDPAREASASPPNAVQHAPRLLTSGQPPSRWFASDDAAAIQVIVHLWATKSAEPTFNEAVVVGQQRKLYVFQTIDFEHPVDEDLVTFLRVLTAFDGLDVQVHCQLNMLASSMVFLYEVIERKRDADVAYEDVVRVWSPNLVWQNYFRTSLARHGIAFEPH